MIRYALACDDFDAVMGQTYEVWFIKGDFLYEVSTYKELEPGLNEIMSTLAIYINSRPLITTEAASWGGLGALIGFPLKVSF